MDRYIGIDVGGTNIAAGLVEKDGRIVKKKSVPAGAGRPFPLIVEEMAALARELAGAAEIGSVGIGVPSTIDPRNGRVLFANNLGWRDLDLAEEFKKHWDIPVLLGNDADCAALGEALAGYGGSYENVVFVTLGTGFGGGIILGGRLFKGGDNSGIEPGHIPLVFDGLPCTCGLRGCLESYASASALIRQTREKMEADRDSLLWKICGKDPGAVDGRTAFDAARVGDRAAAEVVEAFVGYAAAGIGSLITLYRPQAVIVGGGLSSEGDYLLGPLYRETKRRIYASELMPPILKARLGNDAGIVGAALLGPGQS